MHIFFAAFPTCGPEQFTCANYRCIDRDQLCDGIDNCRDGNYTDETNCRKSFQSSERIVLISVSAQTRLILLCLANRCRVKAIWDDTDVWSNRCW